MVQVGFTMIVEVFVGQHFPTQPTVTMDVCRTGHSQIASSTGQIIGSLRVMVTVGQAGAMVVMPFVIVVLRGHFTGSSGARVMRAWGWQSEWLTRLVGVVLAG